MSQTIHKEVLTGEVLQVYRADSYARVSVGISAGAAVSAFVGKRSTIPPAGGSDSWQGPCEFGVAPGDEIFLGSTAVPFNGFDLVISPIPWPVEKKLVQSQFFFWNACPAIGVGNATRLFAADEWCEVTIGIRATSPGIGLFSFNSSLQDAFNLAAAPGTPFVKAIMKPGDQLFGAATVAAVTSDFQIIVSPAPWWGQKIMNMAGLISGA